MTADVHGIIRTERWYRSMRGSAVDHRRALSTGCAAHAIQDGLGAATYVLVPILAQTFGLGHAQIGLIKGAHALTQAALEMASGVLCERIGEARSLVSGLVPAGLGFAALSVADASTPVLICLLLVGAGAAFQHAPASSLVSSSFGIERRRGALGLYNAAGDVGKLAFSGALVLAIDAALPWQQVTIACGVIALAGALAIGLTLRTEAGT